MPEEFKDIAHNDILRYEEILKVCRAAVDLGVDRFKVTGGEPLVRKGAIGFIKDLKSLAGVKCVTLTTNGSLLREAVPALKDAGVDAINVSLDAASEDVYEAISGKSGAGEVLRAIDDCVQSGLRTKVNTVLLKANRGEWLKIVEIARKNPVDVRFIELMPVGYARKADGPYVDEALETIKSRYNDLTKSHEKRGNGPAIYFKSESLQGRIGFIGANSHIFCDSCNRIRLTSTGELKPCLSYEKGTDLRTAIRSGADGAQIKALLAQAIFDKPNAHCFLREDEAAERRLMSQIGG